MLIISELGLFSFKIGSFRLQYSTNIRSILMIGQKLSIFLHRLQLHHSTIQAQHTERASDVAPNSFERGRGRAVFKGRLPLSPFRRECKAVPLHPRHFVSDSTLHRSVYPTINRYRVGGSNRSGKTPKNRDNARQSLPPPLEKKSVSISRRVA